MGSQHPLFGGVSGFDALAEGLEDREERDQILKQMAGHIERHLKSNDPEKTRAVLAVLMMLSPEDLLSLLAMLKPEIFQSLMDSMGQTAFNAQGQKNAGGAQPQNAPRAPARVAPVSSGGGGSSGGHSGHASHAAPPSGGQTSHAGHDHAHGASSTGTASNASNPSGNTNAPAGVPDVGNVVPGKNGVPSGLKPNAARGAAIVRDHFKFDGTIGGVGHRDGPSDHPHGNAIDVMTHGNTALGNSITNYFVQNAEALGVKYVIYQQRIYSPSNGWRGAPMEDRGSPTANHMDHPHISFH